jgi:CBS domain-containing protein
LRPQFVEDIVQTDVSVASPDTSVQEVVAEMADRNVGSVVIVENDVPVGIVTDRSIALAVGQTRDVSKTAVGDLMTPDPVTATPDTSVFDAIDLMHDASVRRLPVVDDDGTLRGIVALDDVLVTFSAELDRATEIIEAQSPSR